MSALSDVEKIAIATALLLIFVLCIAFFRRMVNAERRLVDAERRLTEAERQSARDNSKRPIGFLAKFEPA